MTGGGVRYNRKRGRARPASRPAVSVERDVLVRYLDAWTATVLRSPRGAAYVECGDFAADAFRVFGEFADRLDDHHLEAVLVGRPVPPGGAPAGLAVRTVVSTVE
ncbi:hypothetical protein [Amycolatopsis sp. NPDC051128]|uniref:hypothetical protein n=1 Tax=Amycolatopsis sp. NPDC051128 TaxID=3155412 RepID=UPI00341B7AC5